MVIGNVVSVRKCRYAYVDVNLREVGLVLEIGAMISPNDMKLKLLLGSYNAFLLRICFAKKSVVGIAKVQLYMLGVLGKPRQHAILSFPPYQ